MMLSRCVLIVCAFSCIQFSLAAPPAKNMPATKLTANGEQLAAKYAAILDTIKTEIVQVAPKKDEQLQEKLLSAIAEVKKATADVNSAQQLLDKIATAEALVGHAKGKWLGGAEKGIATAEAALKKATTDAEREAAQKQLSHWQADKAAGLKALAERQAALETAKADQAKSVEASKIAKAALANAEANKRKISQELIGNVTSFLSSDKHDTQLLQGAILAQATPAGLAEFAQQGKEQEVLVEKLLNHSAFMKQILEAGGASGGKYGQAMQIYAAIRQVSPQSRDGLFQRLALAVSLEHAVPVAQSNPLNQQTTAPATVDPVKRYLHYEKAYLNGELDPAFKDLAVWEYRLVVNGDEPDEILSWGRTMLRNYRPDHILNPDYGWRYSGIVRTDVKYGSQDVKNDKPTLQSYQNIINNGGICGRRAFFGRFILRCFGIPTAARPQRGHAALTHWTPKGWIVNLGAGWGCAESKGILGMTDSDFLLETQVRKIPSEHIKALRAQWLGDVLGEEKYISFKQGSGGWWNNLAVFQKQAIVADTKPVQLNALGTELGEANESAATKATAVAKAIVTDADKKIVTNATGTITIPAGACKGSVQPVNSFLGGQQMICGGAFSCEIEVPQTGKYALSARIVTVHENIHVSLATSSTKSEVDISLPYSIGMWQNSIGMWQSIEPVEITLNQGKQTLNFVKPTGSFTLKEITLTPIK